MGDPRLWQQARPVERFDRPDLHALIADMEETMHHLDGAGLAAPQIGVGLRVVIFGVECNPRYPDAELVPRTVLINPVLTPLSAAIEEGWEGCLSVPGLRGWVPRWRNLRYTGFDAVGRPIDRTVAWCNTNATTSTAFSIRCGSGISAASVSLTSFFRTVVPVRSNSVLPRVRCRRPLARRRWQPATALRGNDF